jgi:hypothetical protein
VGSRDKNMNSHKIRAGSPVRGGGVGGIGGDVRVRELHTPTVCMAGRELISGFDDSKGNKAQK